MKRAPSGVAVLGEIAAELDDLDQDIRQCILTPKRSVPLNPEKGCDLDQFRDRPLNVRHMFVAAEVRETLERDVPRIKVSAVNVEAEFTSVKIRVTWSPKEQVLEEFITTEVVYVF
ncbi:hypothetical protein [Planktotalea sp.]|uniref:hypothetical protein n=1 Tax=Planktotalea sp. TaxID=2029877 RepID=UPI003D6BEE74